MWTRCWKCKQEIKNPSESNYIKTRSGNFDLCTECYIAFIEHNKDLIQSERSRKHEIERSLYTAVSDWHDKLMDEGHKFITNFGRNKVPPVMQHKGSSYHDCDTCKEILSTRCCEKCEKYS